MATSEGDFSHPDAATLVEAVQAFLERVRGELAGASAFEARIAANVLAIVARELRGPAPELQDLTSLDGLITRTLAQLAIDNPGYSTFARFRQRMEP